MSNERAFRGVWIPADIWMNRDLSLQEKVMLIEIDSLQHPGRGCFKTNKKLAEFFGLTAGRVSQIVKSLEEKGFVRVEQIRQGKQIVERRIFMVAALGAPLEGSKNPKEGYLENAANPSKNPKEGYLENAEERGSGLGVQYEGETPNDQRDALNEAFELFCSAGMIKVGKAKAQAKFKTLAKDRKEDPETFARMLVRDVKARLSAGVFGFDRLHPTTYLNGQRWDDEIVGDLPANVHSFHDRRPAASSDDCGGKVYIPTPANGGAS